MSKEDRPAFVDVRGSENVDVRNITHIGDGDAISVTRSYNVRVEDVEKRGRGSAVRADGVENLIIRNIRDMNEIDPSLQKALIEDVRNKNRESFMAKIYRFGNIIPAEKIDALMNLWNRIPF